MTTPTAVALEDAKVAFRLGDGRVYTAVEKAASRGRAGRVRRHRRADRLRKIHAAQRRGRPAQAGRRQRQDIRPAARRAEPGRRLPVPGRRAVPLEDCAGQCRDRARDQGHAACRGAAAGAEMARLGWPRRLCQPLSAHALRRPAQARGAGAGADPRPKDPVDGRAVRAARCADAPGDGQSAARSLECGPQGRAVRHPRSRGGDRARRPRRDHVGGAVLAHHRRLARDAAARRATSSRCGWTRSSMRCIARSGACSRTR